MSNEHTIENLMEEFDFKKVRRVMQSLNWVWYGQGDNFEQAVPTIDAMKEKVRGLFKNCERSFEEYGGHCYCASGGFVVRASEWGNLKEPCFSIAFELEQVDNGMDLEFKELKQEQTQPEMRGGFDYAMESL
jgi:hypothetical protein